MEEPSLLIEFPNCSSGHALIELRTRNRAGERGERALLSDLMRGVEKSGPGRAGERAADADPAHAELAQLRDGREVGADAGVHRLWRDGVDDRLDLAEVAHAGGVEAVGAGGRERGEAPDRLRDVGPADEVRLAARHQHDAAAARVDGGARGAD